MTAALQLTRKRGSITDGTAVDEREIRLSCHSQRHRPMMLASLVKPDPWISLRPE